MSRQIIDPDKSYTFSDFFKLRFNTEDVLNYFGYTKQNTKEEFPKSNIDLPFLAQLEIDIEDVLLHISLENEITRREFLVAPIMLEIRRATQSKLNSEYWFEYDHQLRGSFDYYFRSNQNLLVVEAKNADLTRGFRQLAVEMIALDKADEPKEDILYGVLTTGQEWVFAKLNRSTKLISESINVRTLPANLEDVVRTLIGILEN